MNTREIISSGLLEAHVAGALDAQDQTMVESAISQHHEVAAEVTAIEETMWQFAAANAVAPPPALQDRIWNAIEAAPARKGGRAIAFEGASPARGKRFSLALAASVAALVGSLALNYVLWNKSSSAAENTVAMQRRMDSLSTQQQQTLASLNRFQQQSDMMADPSMKPILMQTTQPAHPMAAMVYYNKQNGQSFVAVQKLPPPPSGKQYQLWVISAGKPVSLGVLPNEMVGQQGMQEIAANVPDAQAFAISLEQAGGVPQPTMDQIFVMGKVAS